MLKMQGVSKRYGSVQANRDIDLAVPRGQIRGLLGENGSGKTTLMKMLFGLVKADSGTIEFNGRRLHDHTPADAIAAGIGMIHQQFMLVDAMTVAENVMLGWPKAGWWLRSGKMAELIRSASNTYGLDLDPNAVVSDLPLGRRQRVEIVKAILRGAELLILDEPTSNLSPPEISGLFAVMRRLKQEGRSLIFISHKLGEVLEICDEVVVLRDGAVTGQRSVKDATRTDLARMMIGREVDVGINRGRNEPGKEILYIKALSTSQQNGAQPLREITLSMRAGEALALAGVDGNGQAELVDAIAGLRACTAGRIEIGGQDITLASVKTRLVAGLAYIPADRISTSLVPEMSVEDNLAMRDFHRVPLRRGPWLDYTALRSQASSRIAEFDIRCAGPRVPARTLSGGNQQKIVLAREIGRRPRVLLALQPTWGLDPGATRFVIDQIIRLKEAGAAVLYISSELEEVLMVGDRVGVLCKGRLMGIVDRDKVDLTAIGLMMAGVETVDSAGSDRC
jgi:general nucleoside transport system ATP-binding protein